MRETDDIPEPTPRNAGTTPSPHADIECIASGAIGRPVRVVECVGSAYIFEAPPDTTPHGVRAIHTALRKSHPKLAASVVLGHVPPDEDAPALDDAPAEP